MVIILSAWIASIGNTVQYCGATVVAHFGGGAVALYYRVPRQREGWYLYHSGWSIGWEYMHWTPEVPMMNPWVICLLPLWIPFLLVCVPTILVWDRHRRVNPDSCRECGYNLTGNTSGICPECGERI